MWPGRLLLAFFSELVCEMLTSLLLLNLTITTLFLKSSLFVFVCVFSDKTPVQEPLKFLVAAGECLLFDILLLL